MYKTELVDGVSVENVINKLDQKITEMEKCGYRLATMSFLGNAKSSFSF